MDESPAPKVIVELLLLNQRWQQEEKDKHRKTVLIWKVWKGLFMLILKDEMGLKYETTN